VIAGHLAGFLRPQPVAHYLIKIRFEGRQRNGWMDRETGDNQTRRQAGRQTGRYINLLDRWIGWAYSI